MIYVSLIDCYLFEAKLKMRTKRSITWQICLILACIFAATLMAACVPGEAQPGVPTELKTWLLVRAPDNPLSPGKPVTVKSRSEAPTPGVSHIELYLVEFRSPDNNNLILDNILIRSDAAPFEQTVFTAEQPFTPIGPGHYVIKVVGYDKLGHRAESEFIGFTVQ